VLYIEMPLEPTHTQTIIPKQVPRAGRRTGSPTPTMKGETRESPSRRLGGAPFPKDACVASEADETVCVEPEVPELIR